MHVHSINKLQVSNLHALPTFSAGAIIFWWVSISIESTDFPPPPKWHLLNQHLSSERLLMSHFISDQRCHWALRKFVGTNGIAKTVFGLSSSLTEVFPTTVKNFKLSVDKIWNLKHLSTTVYVINYDQVAHHPKCSQFFVNSDQYVRLNCEHTNP